MPAGQVAQKSAETDKFSTSRGHIRAVRALPLKLGAVVCSYRVEDDETDIVTG
jgi:hypothetical protein